MENNLFAKLSKTKSVDISSEVVHGLPRSLSEAQLASVAGGAGKVKVIVFTQGSTVTLTNSVSGGVQDDCKD